jgi:hypothetical protein
VRDDRLSLTWSVRDGSGDEVASGRVLGDLMRLCRDSASVQFPEDEGFAVVHKRLSGAIDGSTTSISRGGFRGVVSVQRFSRREASSEIRVVACASRE